MDLSGNQSSNNFVGSSNQETYIVKRKRDKKPSHFKCPYEKSIKKARINNIDKKKDKLKWERLVDHDLYS